MAYDIGKQGTATIVAALRFYIANANQSTRDTLFNQAVKELTGPGSPHIPVQQDDREMTMLTNLLLGEYCRVGYVD